MKLSLPKIYLIDFIVKSDQEILLMEEEVEKETESEERQKLLDQTLTWCLEVFHVFQHRFLMDRKILIWFKFQELCQLHHLIETWHKVETSLEGIKQHWTFNKN